MHNINELNNDDYNPNGPTALYDAIGDTINWYRYEEDVLMVIVTDGMENASKRYNHKQITNMLDEKEKFRGWTYVYLNNDINVARQGEMLGLNTSKNKSNITIDQLHFGDYISNNLNCAISNYRNNGISLSPGQ